MARNLNWKEVVGVSELKTDKVQILRCFAAEFFGIFLLNFFACGACTAHEALIFPALAFGFAVFISITIVGHVSGGHINPAVTIGLFTCGRISLIKSVIYIIAQCIGAICGSQAFKVLMPASNSSNFGHTTLTQGVTVTQGLGFEFFLGFLLILTVLGACDDSKPDLRYTAPLAIGLAVSLGHLGAIAYTGAGMNPARTLGSAVASGIWDNHWVYWVGPIMGGILASLLYTVVFKDKKTTLDIEGDEREMRKLNSRDYA